jgi:hypothetical protein
MLTRVIYVAGAVLIASLVISYLFRPRGKAVQKNGFVTSQDRLPEPDGGTEPAKVVDASASDRAGKKKAAEVTMVGQPVADPKAGASQPAAAAAPAEHAADPSSQASG